MSENATIYLTFENFANHLGKLNCLLLFICEILALLKPY